MQTAFTEGVAPPGTLRETRTRPNVPALITERLRRLFGVRTQRQEVDYALRRRALLAELYAGRVGVME
ncbi:MAG: DUF5318 family protein, partial [Actinobacteria bacterium]|nr:DUF5318 family protein [Actinomycetota bacterium]